MDGILARSNALSIVIEQVRRPETPPPLGRDTDAMSPICERVEGM